MVQFLFGSEIIFQIISRFGLAKSQNGGGRFKILIWNDHPEQGGTFKKKIEPTVCRFKADHCDNVKE